MELGKLSIRKDVIEELKSKLGEDNVLTSEFDRITRAMAHCVFPLHRWRMHTPDVVVTPESTEQVVEIVKTANKHRVPLVPRSGGSGLSDGALPLKGGIVVDMKKMDKILEIDLTNSTATVQAGVSIDELGRALSKYGYIYPDDPASRHVAVIGARIATNGGSFLSGRYGNPQHLVLSYEIVLPTGKVLRLGGGGGKKIEKSSSGYNLRSLFFGAQGTLGIITEVTVEIFPEPEAEYPAVWGFEGIETAYKTLGRLARSGVACVGGHALWDEKRVEYYRRYHEVYIPLPPECKVKISWWLYGNEDEVEAGRKRFFKICEEGGGVFIGEEPSQVSWGGRHETSVPPLHGRKNGLACPMVWVMEDPAVNYSEIIPVREKWHKIIEKYKFDDWGIFFLSNRRSGQGEYTAGVNIGVDETEFLDNEKRWDEFVNCRREIMNVALEHGGSMSGTHGSTEEGKAGLIRRELGDAEFELMLQLKRTLDPNNIMNPGKWMLDLAYE